MPEGEEKQMMECELEIMKLETKRLLKSERKEERVELTAEAAVHMSSNPKKAWSHFQDLGNWKGMTDTSGTSVIRDKQGNLYLNLNIAERLGIVFKPSLLKHAEIIY